MKFMLYFHFYVLSLGDSVQTYDLGTAIWKEKDTLSFYIYDVGYMGWKIEHILNEHVQEVEKNRYIVKAVYFVSFEGIRAIVHIDSPDAEIRILTGNIPFVIDLHY